MYRLGREEICWLYLNSLKFKVVTTTTTYPLEKNVNKNKTGREMFFKSFVLISYMSWHTETTKNLQDSCYKGGGKRIEVWNVMFVVCGGTVGHPLHGRCPKTE